MKNYYKDYAAIKRKTSTAMKLYDINACLINNFVSYCCVATLWLTFELNFNSTQLNETRPSHDFEIANFNKISRC